MQNTFSQSGNYSEWFLTKIIFQNRYVALETGLDPPPLHGKCHLKFPFWFFEPLPYTMMMMNLTICSNSKMICRTLSLIANSTWLSDASAAVFTADMCEFCLGSHPFLRKIITNGKRYGLSQNSCVFTQCTGDHNAPEHEKRKKNVMIVRLLTMSTFD